MSSAPTRIDDAYDGLIFSPFADRYWGGTDFCNWGYWLDGTKSQAEASQNLVDLVIASLDEKRGRVLDVACGKGATTRALLRYWAPEDVVGINLSQRQLERARRRAPGVDFRRMDAAALGFPDASFAAAICVEAAFHFATRERFLREAKRVLQPGGRFALADILFERIAHEIGRSLHPGNFVPDPTAYGELLRRVGFVDVEVVDVTHECAVRHEQHDARYCATELRAGRISLGTFAALRQRAATRARATRYYVLAAGTRP